MTKTAAKQISSESLEMSRFNGGLTIRVNGPNREQDDERRLDSQMHIGALQQPTVGSELNDGLGGAVHGEF